MLCANFACLNSVKSSRKNDDRVVCQGCVLKMKHNQEKSDDRVVCESCVIKLCAKVVCES